MWPGDRRLLVIIVGVVVASSVMTAMVAVLAPEIRCWARFSACPRSPSTLSAPQESGKLVLVDVPTLPGEPSFGNRREPFPPMSGIGPEVRVDRQVVTNPGRPVAIRLTGWGFHPETIADIDWAMPSGTTYAGTATYVGEGGTFDTSLYWWPLQGGGIAGNNGTWRIKVTDRVSHAAAWTSYVVTSDDGTPSPDQWPTRDTWTPPATGTPTVRATVRGTLCGPYGSRVELELTGFPPGVFIEISTLRADGGRIKLQTWLADGQGAVDHIVDYYTLDGCDRRARFVYRQVVTARPSIKAETAVILTAP
jgi:hypothetical protein